MYGTPASSRLGVPVIGPLTQIWFTLPEMGFRRWIGICISYSRLRNHLILITLEVLCLALKASKNER